MRPMTGLMGGFYRISEWIMRFSVINILWILSNLPIVYLVISVLYSETVPQLITLLLTIALLAPFLFFPATTAMFGVVRKWIMGEEEIPLVKSFWKYYKENYKKSFIGGWILVPAWVVWIVDYVYFSQMFSFFIYFFIVGSIFLYILTLYFFCNLVHLEISMWAMIKNSVLLSLGNPLNTLALG